MRNEKKITYDVRVVYTILASSLLAMALSLLPFIPAQAQTADDFMESISDLEEETAIDLDVQEHEFQEYTAEANKAIRENEQVKNEIGMKEREIKRLKISNQQAEKRNKLLRSQLAITDRKAQKTETELNIIRSKHNTLQGQVQRQQNLLEQSRQRLQARISQIQQTKGQIQAAQHEIKNLQAQERQLNREKAQADRDYIRWKAEQKRVKNRYTQQLRKTQKAQKAAIASGRRLGR
jgi:chromosome segregation ATPase